MSLPNPSRKVRGLLQGGSLVSVTTSGLGAVPSQGPVAAQYSTGNSVDLSPVPVERGVKVTRSSQRRTTARVALLHDATARNGSQ
jgi:hypothetical protein